MDDTILKEAFQRTTQRLSGHGIRTVSLLQEALLAVPPEESEADLYGTGLLIESFEEKMATYLGKEAAAFFPSGTMAQQIALRIWCDRANLARVAYHPLCHLEIHEQDGLKKLHRVESLLIGNRDRLITLEDLQSMDSPVAALLLELPQREIGGVLPAYQDLVAQSQYCQDHGIKRHLDGARLYETLPYYQKSAADIASLFDSVYISFYKGIGGVAGAILAGETDFIQEAKIWKRRHGGDLISLYPYTVAADYYFETRINKMAQYWAGAQSLAQRFNHLPTVVTRPLIPQTNMFHVHFQHARAMVEPVLKHLYQMTDIGFTGALHRVNDGECSFEISVGDAYEKIAPVKLDEAFHLLHEGLMTQ